MSESESKDRVKCRHTKKTSGTQKYDNRERQTQRKEEEKKDKGKEENINRGKEKKSSKQVEKQTYEINIKT